MRQLWISVAILAGMVLLLSWNMVHVHQLTEPMREDLSQAVAAAREEDWQKAEALTQKAQEHWQSNVSYLRFVQFHEEIDEVTVLLKEAKGFLWDREVGEYTAMSVRICGKLEAMCGLETFSNVNENNSLTRSGMRCILSRSSKRRDSHAADYKGSHRTPARNFRYGPEAFLGKGL